MKLEEISQLVESRKFRPFVIVTNTGARLPVPHPEFVTIPCYGDTQPEWLAIYIGDDCQIPLDASAIDHIEY